MAASAIATDEQVRKAHTPSPRERIREYIARRQDGPSAPSNFEAMCQAIALDPLSGPVPCDDCDGTGVRELRPDIVADYQARIDSKLDAVSELLEQIKNCAPDQFDGSHARQKLELRLFDTEENVRKLRRELNRRRVCRSCRGSTVGPRRRGDVVLRGDSMFSTVTCPACRGMDARKHGLLPHRHYGSSAGEVRLRGTRPMRDPDVEGLTKPSARDDAAAERGDVCLRCFDPRAGRSLAYLVPLTVRPTLKTSEVLERPEGVEELPEHFPDSDFAAEAEPKDGPDVGTWLTDLRHQDPELAAGVAAYLSPFGDRWAEHAWGRRFALWPFLDAGQALAEGAPGHTTDDPYPRQLELIADERRDETQAEQADDGRRCLISMADDAARLFEGRILDAIRGAPGA
jgi:hypothetical protein